MNNNLTAVFARVRAALKRRGRSDEDADDLVQEAFLRLRRYETTQPVENPEGFLMKAALNLSIDGYRTADRHGEEVLLEDVVIVDTAPAAEDVLLLGVAFAHGVELTHQALHHTGFTSRRANQVFGIALGLPMLVSFHEYRIDHLRHHAHLGTPSDREFFDYDSRSSNWLGQVERFTMARHYTRFLMTALRAFRRKPIGEYPEQYQTQVRSFYFIACAAIAVIVVICIAVGSVRPVLAWLVPLVLVASPLHVCIEMPEHYACDKQSPDIFRNTREIRSNRFMTWLTNGNNLHVGHHMWPSVPLQKLPGLFVRYEERLLHVNQGYFHFYALAARSWLSRASQSGARTTR